MARIVRDYKESIETLSIKKKQKTKKHRRFGTIYRHLLGIQKKEI